MMKTIEETYKERLQMLTSKHGGQTGLSKLIDKSPAQISQWINGSPDSKTGKPRSMKSDTAREIENALGLPRAWFDQPVNEVALVTDNGAVKQGYVRFNLLDVNAAAGGGRFNTDYPETVQVFDVSEQWARQHLGPRIEDISLITAYGDSMLPTFADGDLLFVDTSVKEWREEGVYIFSTPSGLKVKRLHVMMNGSLKIISDNKEHYETEIVSGSDLESINICGKVKAAWTLHAV